MGHPVNMLCSAAIAFLTLLLAACTSSPKEHAEHAEPAGSLEPAATDTDAPRDPAAEHAATVGALMFLKLGSAFEDDKAGHTGDAKIRWDSYQERDRNAQALIKLGRIEEATAIYLELWKEGSDPSAPEGSPFTYMVAQNIAKLVRAHPTARDVFVEHLQTMRTRIDRCDAPIGLLNDFAHLAQAAQEPDQLIEHLDAISTQDCMVRLWQRTSKRYGTWEWYLRTSGREDLAEMIKHGRAKK
jgi:hypothetical protein